MSPGHEEAGGCILPAAAASRQGRVMFFLLGWLMKKRQGARPARLAQWTDAPYHSDRYLAILTGGRCGRWQGASPIRRSSVRRNCPWKRGSRCRDLSARHQLLHWLAAAESTTACCPDSGSSIDQHCVMFRGRGGTVVRCRTPRPGSSG